MQYNIFRVKDEKQYNIFRVKDEKGLLEEMKIKNYIKSNNEKR